MDAIARFIAAARSASAPVRVAGLACACALLAGCPHGGPYPLGEPDASLFETALLGDWQHVPQEPDDDTEMTDCGLADLQFVRLDAARYAMAYDILGICEPASGLAWISRIDGDLFLNMTADDEEREAGEDSVRYTLARIHLNGDTLVMRLLSDVLGEGISSTAELRQAVRTRINDPEIYDTEPDSMVFVRVPRSPQTSRLDG